MSTININGVGFSATVEVQEGETLTDALERAGLADVESLDVTADGEQVSDPSQVQGDTVSEVAATPKNASLG